MQDIDMKTLIKYAAIAAAVYFVYVTFVKDDDEKKDGDGAQRVGSGDGQRPQPGQPAQRPTPAPPDLPQQPAPPRASEYRAVVSIYPLRSPLLNKSGGRQTATVDEWNYWLRELNPNAVITDLGDGIPRRQITVDQYLGAREEQGLATGAEASVPSSRGVDNRGTGRGEASSSLRGYDSIYGGRPN